MQIISVLVLFNVFLELCYNSVNAIAKVEDDHNQPSQILNQTGLTLDDFVEDNDIKEILSVLKIPASYVESIQKNIKNYSIYGRDIFDSFYVDLLYCDAVAGVRTTTKTFVNKLTDNGKYLFDFLPLDSVILNNKTVSGSTFIIYKVDSSDSVSRQYFFPKEREAIVAGYILYTNPTTLVVSFKENANVFEFDKEQDTYKYVGSLLGSSVGSLELTGSLVANYHNMLKKNETSTFEDSKIETYYSMIDGPTIAKPFKFIARNALNSLKKKSDVLPTADKN